METFGRLNAKTVGGAEGHLAPHAQPVNDLILRFRHHARLGDDQEIYIF